MSNIIEEYIKPLLIRESKDLSEINVDYLISIKNDRKELFEWVFKLNDYYSFGWKILQLALNYVDLFLSKVNFDNKNLKNLMCGALNLAMKLEDVHFAENNKISVGIRYEEQIFKALLGKLLRTTFDELFAAFLDYCKNDLKIMLDEIPDIINVVSFFYNTMIINSDFLKYKTSSLMLVCLYTFLNQITLEENFVKNLFSYVISQNVFDQDDFNSCLSFSYPFLLKEISKERVKEESLLEENLIESVKEETMKFEKFGEISTCEGENDSDKEFYDFFKADEVLI